MISRSRAIQLRKLIEKGIASLDDSDALDAVTLFPEWDVGIAVVLGERYAYQDKLYKVVQAHTTQSGWEPDITPALWAEVAKPGEIPVWKQPSGAQDAYMKGDKVHYPEKSSPVYVSVVDNNVWQPNIYGWELEA